MLLKGRIGSYTDRKAMGNVNQQRCLESCIIVGNIDKIMEKIEHEDLLCDTTKHLNVGKSIFTGCNAN